MQDDKCKYQRSICIYDGEIDIVCGKHWEETGQDKLPFYERDKIFCLGMKGCTYKMLTHTKTINIKKKSKFKITD